jgi:hypothetical protein
MIEMMIESTSSSSNVHRVVDNNNNTYRNMVMDVMRINWGYDGQCSNHNKDDHNILFIKFN